ncbi:hypothetical protein FRAHR75_50171 [Frankia sp. Hr75.2]|nr:hypothetical protein FRAHR75_50171 [Frankia sp. Hr75.2]
MCIPVISEPTRDHWGQWLHVKELATR